MIIEPIDNLVDPLGVHDFKTHNQNKSLTLKRFGVLYTRFPWRTKAGNPIVFSRYLSKSSWGEQGRPRLIYNGSDLDERHDFKQVYLTSKVLKRVQRSINRKAFWSRVASERRLYKLRVESTSFVKHALHTFVHAWLPEVEDDERGVLSANTSDSFDIGDLVTIKRKLRSLESERLKKFEEIRVLPTTTDPHVM